MKYQHNAGLSKKLLPILSLVVSCIFLIVFSCKSDSEAPKIKQGIIVFEIGYTNTSGRNIPIQLLPKNMQFKFNENFASYTLEDRLGLFSISNIIDIKNRTHTTMIKVFDKKFVYKGTSNETSILFSSPSPFIVSNLSDTARVAGYLCHKASIKDTSRKKTFDVLYCNNIKIEHPNYNTPYQNVDGVLLNFVLQLKNIDMKLVAKKITAQDVLDPEFHVPSEYKLITKKQMEEIIVSMLP